MSQLDVHDLSLDDREAALALRHRSFGPISSGMLEWWDPLFAKTVRTQRALGVYDGTQLVAMARLHACQQMWGGQSLPMSGVAGVIVLPEWRGRGVATMLMNAVLERGVDLGDVVSVLFPAAIAPYRRIGYELAGSVFRTTFDATPLRGLGVPAVPVRRATIDDVDTMTDLLRRIDAERRESGPLVLSADDVRELVEDDDNICYLADDGVLVYAWDGDDLRVERLAAATAETTRALWAVVASGSSVVRGVYTYASSLDPIHWITDAKARLQVEQERWMMRIIDVGKAIALRGYPAAVDAQVPLRLEDAWLSGCAGDFDLSVRGGRGELVAVPERADSERVVRLGPNGLAALYAGTPPHVLEQARLIDGGTAEQYATLATVFAAHPSMIDKF